MRVILRPTIPGGPPTVRFDAAQGLRAPGESEEFVRYGGRFGRPQRRQGLGVWLGQMVSAWVGLRRGGREKAMKEMRVLETLPLGGRRQMVLVMCQGERFLVGCGADEVQTIVHVPGAPSVPSTFKDGSCA